MLENKEVLRRFPILVARAINKLNNESDEYFLSPIIIIRNYVPWEMVIPNGCFCIQYKNTDTVYLLSEINRVTIYEDLTLSDKEIFTNILLVCRTEEKQINSNVVLRRTYWPVIVNP